jgi:transcriptional regulator with XRE-family HTH domain
MATSSQVSRGDESLGARLARLRVARGRSQLRLAELLCAASGTATVTRHEVSRWEREHRVPNAYWLRWLAVVLEVPLGELEQAAAATRGARSAGRRVAPAAPADDWRYWPEVRAPGAGREWTLAELRRLDDLMGGADLSPLVNHALRVAGARRDPGPAGLAAIAGLAQLAGWVNGDGGHAAAAVAAHRLGLRAARAAGDPALIGHLLGNAAQLTADPARALALARAGAVEGARAAPAGARALALQRVAYAAARAGAARECERAIAAADRQYGRRDPADEPPWLYWLTDSEYAALSGRCFAVLHRPRLAVPLLSHGLAGIRQPRPVALYTTWLAEAHLDAGAPERAAELAADALPAAVRSGSVRAAARVRSLHSRLVALPRSVVDRYLRVATEGLSYLADVTGSAAAVAAGSG